MEFGNVAIMAFNMNIKMGLPYLFFCSRSSVSRFVKTIVVANL
jgi:hypothetical protein